MNLLKKIKSVDVTYCLICLAMLAVCAALGCKINRQQNPKTQADKLIAEKTRLADKSEEIKRKLPARVGNIYVSNRHSCTMAASSRYVPSCFVDPSLVDRNQLREISIKLGKLFEMSAREIFEKLYDKKMSGRKFAWVKREISREEFADVRALKRKYKLRAVGIEYEWRREYPLGNFAGPVIGFRRKDNEPGAGIELSINRLLKAEDGKRVMRGDASRRPLFGNLEKSVRPKDGRNVYLTIDAVMQKHLQQAVSEAVDKYDAQWGTGIIMDPQTGDVLAMVSAPTFDPNNYSFYSGERMGMMLNRSVSCSYEPGSIFKPFIAASAVEDGLCTYDTKFYCERGVYHARRGGRITDHGSRYGFLSLGDIIVKSSNVGMAKVGEKYGNKRLYELVHKWGFGCKTGIDLPGELPGNVRMLRSWNGYSLRRVPFGQEISTTPLQIATAFCAFANGGKLLKPRIVRLITDQRNRIVYRTRPEIIRQVISPEVAKQSRHVMEDVVKRGTAKKARSKKYSIWGKTGTAQVSNSQGYISGAYNGSFIAGAPVENPSLICLISIYRPGRNKKYYGGTVAAPYVKDVLEKSLAYLKVKPDKK